MDVGDYFDENYERYDQNLLDQDHEFAKFIQKNKNIDSTLLDVGGNGNFSKLVRHNFPDMHVTIIDPSKKLLSKIEDPEIKKIDGRLPYNIPMDVKYDFIHIKEVLHHITGKNITDTKKLLKESLKNLKMILNENGFLMIHEIYVEGFLFPELPSYIMFYALILQNRLNLKLPIDDSFLGLEVYFYTRKELKDLLKECGFEIVTYKTYEWSNTIRKKMLLVKNWGRVLIIAKKIK
ncbi:MAG: methyltransferase domain-containing protein [Methanobacteriaceae archaeon]|jgi:hypothetical protein